MNNSNNPLDSFISYSGFHRKTTFVNPDVNVVPSMGDDFDVGNTTWECDWTEKTFKLKPFTAFIGDFIPISAIFAQYGTFYGEGAAPDLGTFAEGSRGIISLVPHLKVLTSEGGVLGIQVEKGVEVRKRLPLIIVIDGIPKITTIMVR